MSVDLEFFGLQEPPFSPAPDPRFLHMTPGHQEALAQLQYGVEQHKGFILLTGEVGTGKTSLLHALLEQLDSETAVAFVTNSMLDFEGILEYVQSDLGIAEPGECSLARRLIALQDFLIERRRAGQNTVIVLDEAQDLEPETLERIRLLSNFETMSEKILQIVLSGQPELWAKLDLPQLRQLKQRIGLRCRISPLAADEVHEYIRTRLRIAGLRDLGLFSPQAIRRIAQYSGGIPRVVNTVCDHCLLFAYADQVRTIERRTVEETIRYLEDGTRSRRHRPRSIAGWRAAGVPWPLLAASAGLAGLATLGTAHPGVLWKAIDLGASSITDLARAARAWLPQ